MLGHPLQPHRIMRALSARGAPWTTCPGPRDPKNAQLCCECGICETYACPMSLFPRKINSMLKKKLGAAGIRYQPRKGSSGRPAPTGPCARPPRSEWLPGPGSGPYDYEISQCQVASPTGWRSPCKCTSVLPRFPWSPPGDQVAVGTLIAQPPGWGRHGGQDPRQPGRPGGLRVGTAL